MNEATSSVRGPQLPPPAGDAAEPRVDGSSRSTASIPQRGSSVARPAVRTEQPTVISNRQGPQTLVPISESAYRFLQGKIAPGDQLGHFELVEYIGGGGMGRVFRAYDTRLARHVAVKILAPDQGADEETRLRFQHEAQSAARLDHENIARVFYVGEDHGLQYIVFEYIEGDNMRDLVERRGPLPLGEAVSFTLQVAEALDHAWQRAVVHRDIKPSNVLITRGGRVKLIDMGLARFHQVDAAADLTASGVTLGTFDYISPEQARDPRAADVRSDIYSLGCTLFFMLTGRPPFPDGTVLQKLLQHQGDPPPDVRQLRTDLPDELARIVRKMLAKDPKHRHATPRMLMDELLLAARQCGLNPLGEAVPGWNDLPRRSSSLLQRHLPWLAPVAALLAIAAALHLFWSAEDVPNERLPAIVSNNRPLDPTDDDPARGPDESAGGQTSSGQTPGWQTPGWQTPGWQTPGGQASGGQTPGAKAGNGSAPGGLRIDGSPGSLPHAPGAPFDAPPGDSLRLGQRGAVAIPVQAGPESDWTSLRTSLDPALLGIPGKRPPRAGVLSVVEKPEGDGQFASVAQACAAARDGDVIELCFQGAKEENPIRLANLRLTIRAGEGFRPTLRFRPLIPDAGAAAHAVIEASGGRLTLLQTSIELALPAQVSAERWSLFQLRDGQTLRLDKCSLTVSQGADARETPLRGAAFFRAAPPARSAAPGDEADTVSPIILELANCIVRGEGVMLKSEQLQPVRLTWQNGLLAVSESLLAAEGGLDAPDASDAIEIDLQRVTAYAPAGLCVFNELQGSNPRGLAPSLGLPAELRLADCIVIGDGRRPMIAHATSAAMEVVSRRFSWTGDHNSYQNLPLLWLIRGADDRDIFRMSFDEWSDYWGGKSEDNCNASPLDWKRPLDATRAAHALTPEDFQLGDIQQTPSADTSSDGGKIGLRIDLLPSLGR